MRIVIDWDRCIGSGMCTGIAPELFELAADGTLIVRVEEPGAEFAEKLDAAIACCPVEAISRVD